MESRRKCKSRSLVAALVCARATTLLGMTRQVGAALLSAGIRSDSGRQARMPVGASGVGEMEHRPCGPVLEGDRPGGLSLLGMAWGRGDRQECLVLPGQECLSRPNSLRQAGTRTLLFLKLEKTHPSQASAPPFRSSKELTFLGSLRPRMRRIWHKPVGLSIESSNRSTHGRESELAIGMKAQKIWSRNAFRCTRYA